MSLHDEKHIEIEPWSEWSWDTAKNMKHMLGKKFIEICQNHAEDELYFVCEDGYTYCFYHQQDCCESVFIDDIVGDLRDLTGLPLLVAEESTSTGEDDGGGYTWTFYKFATIKGHVDIKWYGVSNGFYSESVSLKRYKT